MHDFVMENPEILEYRISLPRVKRIFSIKQKIFKKNNISSRVFKWINESKKALETVVLWNMAKISS